jgi:hypothetical protein
MLVMALDGTNSQLLNEISKEMLVSQQEQNGTFNNSKKNSSGVSRVVRA